MVKIKNQGINIIVQAKKLESYFPESTITRSVNKLVWKGSLQPTVLSDAYDIKLEYKVGFHPCVYVINKKLELREGETKLPHVYNTEDQWLCLYYRKAQEWNNRLFIADTIIPWTSEWLFHYEHWLATGKWHGRGIHGKQTPFEKDKSSAPNNI